MTKIDPFTISMVVGAIGGVFNAYSGFQGAKQNQYNAEAQAKALANQAKAEEATRNENAKIEKRLASRKNAAMTAAYGKSGLLLTGTPSEVLADTAATQEVDIQQKNVDTANRVKGLRYNQKQTEAQARSYKRGAPMALIGGLVQAGGQAAGQYAWWNKGQ